MSPIETYNNIRTVFHSLENANSVSALDNIIQERNLTKAISDFKNKYPKFDFSLTVDEIISLKQLGIITEDHKLNTDKFPIHDPLSKLLAAVLWKNGDIHKVQHLLDGISESPISTSEHALIFRQFGKSLANLNEPIVDQHVLRSFEIYCLAEYSEENVTKLKKKGIYKSADDKLLGKYRLWFKRKISKIPTDDILDYKDKLDKILFLIGKMSKL